VTKELLDAVKEVLYEWRHARKYLDAPSHTEHKMRVAMDALERAAKQAEP